MFSHHFITQKPSMPNISLEHRWHIATWTRDGLGARIIQRKLKIACGVWYSLGGIQKVIKKYTQTGEVKDQTGRGCKKSARTPQNIAAVDAEIHKDAITSSPKKTPKRLATKLHI